MGGWKILATLTEPELKPAATRWTELSSGPELEPEAIRASAVFDRRKLNGSKADSSETAFRSPSDASRLDGRLSRGRHATSSCREKPPCVKHSSGGWPESADRPIASYPAPVFRHTQECSKYPSLGTARCNRPDSSRNCFINPTYSDLDSNVSSVSGLTARCHSAKLPRTEQDFRQGYRRLTQCGPRGLISSPM